MRLKMFEAMITRKKKLIEGIENWETTKTPRYKTDEGQLNFRQVTYVPKMSSMRNEHHKSAMSVCSNDMDDDTKMVLEWSVVFEEKLSYLFIKIYLHIV